jgi:predicted dinucleotide-binding enzyme
MARTALRAGRSVVIANSRGPGSLTSVVSALGAGASAGTVAQASAAGIVVIAVPWARVPEAVQGLQWNGQIVSTPRTTSIPAILTGEPQASVSSALSAVPAWSRPRTPSALRFSAQIPTRLGAGE